MFDRVHVGLKFLWNVMLNSILTDGNWVVCHLAYPQRRALEPQQKDRCCCLKKLMWGPFLSKPANSTVLRNVCYIIWVGLKHENTEYIINAHKMISVSAFPTIYLRCKNANLFIELRDMVLAGTNVRSRLWRTKPVWKLLPYCQFRLWLNNHWLVATNKQHRSNDYNDEW